MSHLIDQYQTVVKVLGLHSEGNSIRVALRKVGGMTRQAFERVCAQDDDLRQLRMEAARCFREGYHDLLLNIDDDPEQGRTDPKMAAVISANIKHVLAVDDPERFGNKLKVEHNITASEAITRALDAARQRAATGIVIDAVVTEIAEASFEMVEAAGGKEKLPPPPLSATVMPPGDASDPFAALAAFVQD